MAALAERQVITNPDKITAYYHKAKGNMKLLLVGGSERLMNFYDPQSIRNGLQRVRELVPQASSGSIVDAGAGWGGRAWILLEFYDEYFSFDMMHNFCEEFNMEIRPALQNLNPGKKVAPMLC